MNFKKIIGSFLICAMLLMTGITALSAEVHQAVIEKITVTGAQVTVQGSVKAINGVVKSGQFVTMLVLNPGNTVDQVTPQTMLSGLNSIGQKTLCTTTGLDGSFVFQFSQPASATFGLYKVLIGGTFIQSPQEAEFYFVQQSIEAVVLNAVNSADSLSQLTAVLDTIMTAGGNTAAYKEILALDTNVGYDNLTDKSVVLSALVKKNFKTADAVRLAFNEAVATERINQSVDVSEIKAAIAEQNAVLKLDLTQAFQAVIDKDAVYGALIEPVFVNTTDVVRAFDKAVSLQLQKEYPIAYSNISLTAGSGGVGKSVPVIIKFSESLGIDGFCFDISYNAQNLNVLKTGDVTVNAEFNKEEKEKKIVVDISQSGKIKVNVSSSGAPSACRVTDVVTVNVAIKSNADSGNYPVTVNGYFSVWDNTLGILRKVYIEDKSAQLSVSTSTSKGDGGTGGGGGVGGNIVPVKIVTPDGNPDTEPYETEPKMFADAQSIPSWASVMVYKLVEKNIINGIENSYGQLEFKPDEPVTRAQFVKMLVLAFDLMDDNADVSFSDITTQDWCYPYIASAFNAEITQGISDMAFGPELNITRQDMTVMLDRVLAVKGLRLDPVITPSEFKDEANIAPYALDSIRKMQSARIIEGAQGFFNPNQSATRAAAAKVIYGLMISSK